MDSMWHSKDGLIKYIIVLFIPFLAITHEVFQYLGLVKGTFDVYDLICYSFPLFVYIASSFIKTNVFYFSKLTSV
jgi:hypothetical protein